MSFFENLNLNLKNENINDEKYIPFLKIFSKNQLKVLYQNGIISEEKYNLLITKNQKENQSRFTFNFSSSKETNSTVNDINLFYKGCFILLI